MSMVPMGGHKVAPNPTLVDHYPDVYLTTGLVAENHAREAGITREMQDAFALRSHQRAIAAIDAGRFDEEVVSVGVRPQGPPQQVASTQASSHQGLIGVRPQVGPSAVDVGSDPNPMTIDEGPRRETSLEALAKLKPAFHVHGTVTAGNSSQTSDGASAVIVVSGERARALGIAPLGRFVSFTTAGVQPERFGIGPVPAIRKILKGTGLTLGQIDLVELNEAFAAQMLACLRELPIDPDRLNVNGGAIALGHPLGCTGAKLTTTLLYEMKRRRAHYGLVSMCVGGGMGAAAVFERV
jgi:acetyl-CoA acyltransferase